jgi:hypothetical protein
MFELFVLVSTAATIVLIVLAALGTISPAFLAGALLVEASLVLLWRRTLGWIAWFMMHSGPGDEGTQAYESVWFRAGYVAVVAGACVTLLAHGDIGPGLGALMVAAGCCCVAALLVDGPYHVGIQAIAFLVGLLAAAVALVIGGRHPVFWYVLWSIMGLAAAVTWPRPLSDSQMAARGRI